MANSHFFMSALGPPVDRVPVSHQLPQVPGLAVAHLAPEVVDGEVDRLHVSGEAADPGVGVVAELARVHLLGMIMILILILILA